MTTIEAPTVSLITAVETAGIGGQVQRLGDPYTVGKDSQGEWTLTRDGVVHLLEGLVQDDWTVVSQGEGDEPASEEEETEETQSVREFFHGLNYFTFVRNARSHREWLYVGYDYDAEGNPVVKLIDDFTQNADITGDRLDAENRWEAVPSEDGNGVKVADNFTRLLVRNLRGTRNDMEHYATRSDENAEKLNKANQDLRTINAKINEYADEQGMCSDYERRIFGWNTDLISGFQLEGRPDLNFIFHVPVQIPALAGERQLYVSVNGRDTGIRSPEQARKWVKGMSTNEILRNLYDNGFELEITHNEEKQVTF